MLASDKHQPCHILLSAVHSISRTEITEVEVILDFSQGSRSKEQGLPNSILLTKDVLLITGLLFDAPGHALLCTNHVRIYIVLPDTCNQWKSNNGSV